MVSSLRGCSSELRSWLTETQVTFILVFLSALNKGAIYVAAAALKYRPIVTGTASSGVSTPTEKKQGVHLGLIPSHNLDL